MWVISFWIASVISLAYGCATDADGKVAKVNGHKV